MTEREIFLAVLDLPDTANRSQYLDGACGGDPARRARIESLLLSHDTAGSFLGSPAVTPLAADVSATQEFSSVATPDDDVNKADDALTFLAPAGRPDSLGRIGHYEVLEVLGRGGFGIVFRAVDETLQRVVAVKVLAPQLAATSPARKRFVREARSSAKVRHENVVQVYAVEEQPLPYLVMEFIPGETLQQRLDRTGPLETAEVVQFGRQIAEGLAAAHAMGLIHRDIKPGNILIEAGANPSVKITDFGLARAADDASLTQSGIVAGTPMYMAPEQAQGETLDHRADLFSLGSVLYTMCSGRPPFRANSTVAVLKRVVEDAPRPIQEIIPETPPWLCDIITRLHAKKPEDRFASAQEVADLLRRRLAHMQHPENVQALPDAPPAAAVEKTAPPLEIAAAAPAIRRPRFRTRGWAAAAAVLLLLCAGLGFTEATGVTNVHGSVVRLFSPEGTLVVEVDDPDVSVKIDGSDVVITGAGLKEIRLKTGSYTVEASKNGKVVKQELVTVTKDGKQVVRVSQEAAPSGVKAANQEKDPDRLAAEYVLSVGGMVRLNGSGKENRAAAVDAQWRANEDHRLNEQGQEIRRAADLPRESFRLTYVDLYHNKQVSDAGLAVLRDCKNLTLVELVDTPVTDAGVAHINNCRDLWLEVTPFITDVGLAHLKDCKGLWIVHLVGLPNVTDAGLAHLKDCENLRFINLDSTPVTNAGLVHLKDCINLTELGLHNNARITDAGLVHLKDCKGLTHVNLQHTNVTSAGIDALKKALPKCKIEWDGGVIEPGLKADASAWERSVAVLPAADQVKAVIARLKELNPGFDGAVAPTIEKDAVTGLKFTTDHVTDISPVHSLTRLQTLDMGSYPRNDGLLFDLSPLQGMPLVRLECGGAKVADLSPLKGMKLYRLGAQSISASDLTPLQGMPLTQLDLAYVRGVTNLKPLQGMPLEYLNLSLLPVSDLSALKGMTSLKDLYLQDMTLSDLAPLSGMRLHGLYLAHSKVSDLTPLKGMPLEEIQLTPRNITEGLNILRDMKSLKWISANFDPALPAAEFWDRYDKGEFKE